MLEESQSVKLSFASIAIGIVGFFVSLYALVVHIQIFMRPGHGSLCDINAAFNCTTVISSQYGELASIPLGAYGMTYFIILLSAAILPKYSQVKPKQHAVLEFIISFVGFIAVVSLFYISHFLLKTICPTCSLIHILITIYFVMKLNHLIRKRKNKDSLNSNSDYLIRFLAVCLCLGLPPLAAGLVAPLLIEKFFSSPVKTPSQVVSPETMSHSSISQEEKSRLELLTVHKTNYVGNGEDYRRGSDEAQTVVQMFSDFGCPHCKQANAVLMQMQDQVGLDKVLLVYRFFPLSNECNSSVQTPGWYPYSCILAQGARCAGAQGRFWEFKEWGFSGQDWTDEKRAQSFSMEGLKEEAQILGMNSELFAQCISSGVELNKIKEDAALADKLKIKGTPLILINGKEYNGPHTVESFIQALKN